jgi:hypothetical protein
MREGRRSSSLCYSGSLPERNALEEHSRSKLIFATQPDRQTAESVEFSYHGKSTD